jgi:3D (Asp-Asp-Asp) domain-containing protein
VRLTLIIILAAVFPVFATEKGFWTKVEVRAYSPTQQESLSDGETRYGTNAYQEGCAADRRFYPEGTRIYVEWMQNGEEKGRWFTVDDTHPDTVGKQSLIYLRFMTKKKAEAWSIQECRVYVVLPEKEASK